MMPRVLSCLPRAYQEAQVYCISDILSRKNKTKKIQKDLKRKDASVLSESDDFVTSSTDTDSADDVSTKKGFGKRNKKMGKNKNKLRAQGAEPRNWGSIVEMYGDDDTTEVWDPKTGDGKRIYKGSTKKSYYVDTDNPKMKNKKSYSPSHEEDVNMHGDTDLKKKKNPKRFFKESPSAVVPAYEHADKPKKQRFLNNFHRERKNSYSPSRKDAHTNSDYRCRCIRKAVKFDTHSYDNAEPLQKKEKQTRRKILKENIKFEMKPRLNDGCNSDICGELYKLYQNNNLHHEQNKTTLNAKNKKNRKPRNKVTCLCPETKEIETCSKGLCVEAVKKNKTDFTCKCTKAVFPKECTDITCGVRPSPTNIIPTTVLSNTLSSKTSVTIGKIKCLCRKYSQKIMSNKRKRRRPDKKSRVSEEHAIITNICDTGLCKEAGKQNIKDFTCKCTVVKECTDTTCNVKKYDMDKYKMKFKNKLKELQSIKNKVKLKRNKTCTCINDNKNKQDNADGKQPNIINQGDQSGEPLFEMKVNYDNMCVLNPKEINDGVKSLKEIIRKTCACPSHKKRKRHYLLNQTCHSGPCLKAFKNKRTNFTCTCAKPSTECVDITCEENGDGNRIPRQQGTLQTLSKKYDEPLMDVIVNPKDMCLVNKDQIFRTIKKINKHKQDPCSIGICKEKEKSFTFFTKSNSFICKCLNKKRKEEPTTCSELTCNKANKTFDNLPEQRVSEQPVVLTQSRFLTFCKLKCKERRRRRQLEREAIRKGALLCKDKICARPDTFHMREGIKFRVKKNELGLCNCKECNKRKKQIKEKPKYQCGDMICHDSIVQQMVQKKAGKGQGVGQVKLFGGTGGLIGDGCRCCVCGKGPAECTCTCLSKILNARKYVCASISTLINTINTLRGRPPPLPEPTGNENQSKRHIHVCECRKYMKKMGKKTKKKKKTSKKIVKKVKKKDKKDSKVKQKQLMSEDRKLAKSERKKRRREAKKERKLRKQQIKDLQALSQGKEESQETNCCVDFFVGILKIGVNIVKATVLILLTAIISPKAAYRYSRLRLMDPKGTLLRIKKWFMDFIYLKKMEIAKTMSGSHTMIVLTDTFKDSAFYNAIANKGRTKSERQKLELERKIRHRRVRKRHEEAIYGCRHTLLTTLRKTPCLWVYHICPTLYPQCLSLLTFLRNFSDILLFLAALVVWTPCIVCCELSRACLCCTLCTGG